MKKHPVTGEDVPDESARVPLLRYIAPRPADWPEADFIVGNPPFIGTARMREALGDGYAETLRKTYPAVPESADFVMFWWHKAALLVREGKAERFGFITTNSLRQTFNRRVLETHLNLTDRGLPARTEKQSGLEAHGPLNAPAPFFNPLTETDISEHKLPHWNQADCFCFVTWRMDSADGAAVRIAMTVASAGQHEGKLLRVTKETSGGDSEFAVELAMKGSGLAY